MTPRFGLSWLLFAVLVAFSPAIAFAGPAHFYDEPDTTYATSVVIDIVQHAGGIWFASGAGVNFSFDQGQTWLFYDTTNGLVSVDVSAIYSDGSRLWVATNRTGVVDNQEVIFSDGLSYTDDSGQTWIHLDYSDTASHPDFPTGPFRTIYDITGVRGFAGHSPDSARIFAAAFAGGLLGSADNGRTWQRVFGSTADSVNFARSYAGQDTLWHRNEHFSLAVDTSHGDSLYVWAGTAGGIIQLVYLQPDDKFFARDIQALALCSSCDEDSNFTWYGGINGISRGRTLGLPTLTRFAETGHLPGPRITAIEQFGGILFAGTADSTTDISYGVVTSDDMGLSFGMPELDSVVGPDRLIQDFTSMGSRLYLAGQEAGLYVSADTGGSWARVFLDSSAIDLSNRRNVTWALEALGDTLLVGTDSGLTLLFMDPTGAIDSLRHEVPATDSSSTQITDIGLQLFIDSLTQAVDSYFVWTINRPLVGIGRSTVSVSRDRGLTWRYYLPGAEMYDVAAINVRNDTVHNVYIAGTSGVKLISMGIDPDVVLNAVVQDSIDIALLLSGDTVNVVETRGDTVLFGSRKSGIAISANRGRSYRIFRPNPNPLKADISILHTFANTVNVDDETYGLAGDWLPALEVQYFGPDSAVVIASCRPTVAGFNGISIGGPSPVFDTLDNIIGYKYRWEVVNRRNFAWNIWPHSEDSVFFATDDGMLVGLDLLGSTPTFDTLEFRNANGVDLLFPGTPTYAALTNSGYLWAGTADGTVRVNLDSLADQKLFIRVDPSEEIYAFPVPFSPNRDGRVRFHFPNITPGAVTIEVYDFAMNLVSTPVDAQYLGAGIYPPGPSDDQRPYWDGRNDKGDVAAVGVYHFKVTFANGETKWGKLAIVP